MKDRRVRILRDRAEMARKALSEGGYLEGDSKLGHPGALSRVAADFLTDLVHLAESLKVKIPLGEIARIAMANYSSDTEEELGNRL